MAAVPVRIDGMVTDTDGNAKQVTIVGGMSYPGLEVGGGPIMPPEEPPVDAHPEHPIVLPPDSPPIDAHPEHPIVLPPEDKPPVGGDRPPSMWLPVWIPGYGWVALPAFPHPAPSKAR